MAVREPLDFSPIRARHTNFVGRRDLLAEIDELLLQGTSWVLLVGAPGSGKSALLCHYLDRLETVGTAGLLRRWVWRSTPDPSDAGLETLAERLFTKKDSHGHRIVPQHFLRYLHAGWAAPTTVLKSLTDQLLELFPDCREPKLDETDPRFLNALLKNASEKVLQKEHQRLVIVLDNVDRIDDGNDPTNPLQTFLPRLPPGISVVCSARPFYKALSWMECSGSFVRVDLDDAAASNDATCRAFIQSQLARLPSPFPVDDAMRLSHGNLRYLYELISTVSEESDAPIDPIPIGFTAYMEKLWRTVNLRHEDKAELIKDGLWTICSSSDGLSLSALSQKTSWSSEQGDVFLQAARPLLREISTTGDPLYRPFHSAFRDFLVEKLSVPATPLVAGGGQFRPSKSMPVVSQEVGPIGRRYAFLVGVNGYRESPALKYCVNDAKKLGETLEAKGFSVLSFHDEQEDKLLQPTIENIRAKLGAFRQGFDANDLFLVFFSCHGMLSDGSAYLLGGDSRPTDIEHSGLAVNTVVDFMKATGARRNILVLDACHSGVDLGHDASVEPEPDGGQTMGLQPEFFRRYSSTLGEGTIIVSGSSASQLTLDWDDVQHSVYSYFVIDALSGRADAENKGYVTVNDLCRHTYDGVKDWWFKHFTGGKHQDVTARIEGAAAGEIKIVEIRK